MRKAIALLMGAGALAFVGSTAKDVGARVIQGNTANVFLLQNHLNCFEEGWGHIRSKPGGCSDGRNYADLPVIIPLPIDSAGSHTTRVYVHGATGLNADPDCYWLSAYLATSFPLVAGGGPFAASIDFPGKPYSYAQFAINNPANGSAEVYCFFKTGNQGIMAVDYTP